jgi:hypothetical protein
LGCFGRLGCLTIGVLLGAVGLVVLLATMHTGPRYEDGVYVYEVDGRRTEVPLSPEAARRFDAKVNGNLPAAALPDAVLRGVPITEEELNSRVAEELRQHPVEGYGARVDRVFIRLTATGARAYAYSVVQGVDVVLSSDLVFDVSGGRMDVALRDPQAGRLPVGLLLPSVLGALNDLTGLEQTIAVVMPPQVRAINHEEGQLRVQIDPLARYVPASPPGSYARLSRRAGSR